MTSTAFINNRANTANLSSNRPLQKKQNRLGPYKLLQTLGEGEFGKVKLGVHLETGQEVAIKLIKKDGEGSISRLNKVEREISVLKTLDHPYIVKLHNVVETEKYIGIILEYASGGELFEYILAHRFLKEKDAKKFFAQLISSVQYMHERNIVHRDLKLENLLLDKHRNIIVTDFGFANQFDSETDDLMATTCGSPCYAAPELVINAGLYAGSAVDIWSCGVILYAMLCGFLPFDDDPSNPDSDNINQLYKYIMSTNLMFPSHVSDQAGDLLLKMLVPDPTKRCSLDYIIHHPWLKEYGSYFKTATANVTIGPEHMKAVENNVQKESHIVVQSSTSTTVPKQHAKSGATDVINRKTHIPTVARNRFAPVANENYFTSKQKKEATEEQEIKSKNMFMNFAISQPSATATTSDTPVLVTTLFPSVRTSKIPNFITRKPVKEETNSATAPEINPEKSLSSPVSVNENKTFNLSTFGNIYKSQRRGTDKLLSFFTATKVSQSPADTIEDENDYPAFEASADQVGSLRGSVNEGGSLATDNESSVYQENKYVIHSVSDVSTIGVSVPSLCLSEDISSPTSPITPPPKLLQKPADRKKDRKMEMHVDPSNQTLEQTSNELKSSEYDNVDDSTNSPRIQARGSICTESITSDYGSDSFRSSVVSFKETPRNTTMPNSSKEDPYSSIRVRHHYTQTQQSDNRVSIKPTPTNGNQDSKPEPQPEVSSSTLLVTKAVSNAVGGSGRKAIAAVRKSIYRKHQNQPAATGSQLQNASEVAERKVTTPAKREPLISFSKSRFEESGKQIQNKRNQQTSQNQRHTWGNNPVMASISEMPGKNGAVPEVTSKKTGNKMMDWIKKKSQGKESKKETATTQRVTANRLSPPALKMSTSKKTDLPKNEKQTPVVIQKVTTTAALKAPQDKEIQNKNNNIGLNNQKPPKTNEIIEIPEHNNIRTRKRANSGNSVALKEVAIRENQSSKDQMQIHQGAIDRNALTSQPPATVLQEVARIFRILGIETKLESEFVMKCHRRKAKTFISAEMQKKQGTQEDSEDSGNASVNQQLEPIYGDASIDNGDEIRFAVEICRFKHLPGLYIVDVRRLKGSVWAYKFLYHKLIDFLNFDKDSYITCAQ